MQRELIEIQAKSVAASIRPDVAAFLLSKIEGKKDEVDAAVRLLYRTLVQPIDLPGPDVILDPALEQASVHVARGFYELLVEFLRAKTEEVTDAG
jgi:hypothetical protein